MENFKTFEELECWKEARKLRNHIKDNLIPKLPDYEKYNLTSQISRSSRSIRNNIAEGFGCFNYQENIQLCRMSRGLLTETLDHSIIALDENYITEKKLEEIGIIYNRTLLLINGFIKYLRSK